MKRILAKSIVALAAAAGVYSMPTAARADHLEVRIGERHDRQRVVDRVWVEPVFEDRCTKVWVEPVYRTECAQVLVPETFVTKCDRVWVEPVFEVREVVRFEHGRRICTRERVCVREGGWQNVEHRVCVPAHYEKQDQQVLVAPGHFEERRERVCVREGHYDTVVEHVRSEPRVSVNLGIFGRL